MHFKTKQLIINCSQKPNITPKVKHTKQVQLNIGGEIFHPKIFSCARIQLVQSAHSRNQKITYPRYIEDGPVYI